MAWRYGIWRCSSSMPPSSGRRPTSGSGRPKLASSQATTRSQPSTISKPPPSAKPLTRAITGTLSVSRSAMPPKPPGRDAAQYSTPLRFEVFFRSAPAQKERSPAPVSTTTRTSSRPLDVVPDADQLGLGRQVDRVDHLGPVDGDRGDVVRDFVDARSCAAPPRSARAPRPAPLRCARPAAAARGAGRSARRTCGSGWR